MDYSGVDEDLTQPPKGNAMLVLTRKVQEAIRIDDDIRIVIVRCEKDKVRIAIDAPDEVLILREELWLRQQDFVEATVDEKPGFAFDGQ